MLLVHVKGEGGCFLEKGGRTERMGVGTTYNGLVVG